MPIRFKETERTTITASKQLNLSLRYMRLEAKDFKTISVKKNDRKYVSISAKTYGLTLSPDYVNPA